MKINKVLIVGGTGYIGQALYESLKGHYTVHFTGRSASFNHSNDYKQMDLGDEDSIVSTLTESYDMIIILAATVRIEHSGTIDLDDEIFRHNLYGLNTLLKHLSRLQQTAKLMYMSSMTVYDEHAAVPVTEEAELKPLHSYGLSKVLAEHVFTYYATHNTSNGVIIRIPGVYGGDRKGGYIYNVIRKLLDGEDLEIDSTNLGYWETIHLDDLTGMIGEFLQNYDFRSPCEIFNMSYGIETDFIDTAFSLRETLDLSNTITIKKKDYRRFFLDNAKISAYVSTADYSYVKSLERYARNLR